MRQMETEAGIRAWYRWLIKRPRPCFDGSVRGTAPMAARRQGACDSGIEANVTGLGIGVSVVGSNSVPGRDEFHIYATDGRARRIKIGVVRADDNMEPMFKPAAHIVEQVLPERGAT